MTGAARSSERKRWGAGARLAWTAVTAVLSAFVATPAAATDWTFFPAVDNVTAQLVAHINAETERIDMSAWYLTEHAVSMALVNRHRAGVPVRLIGDRVSIFESDPLTRAEFYWLASQGLPIRLRYFPTWQPEIVHWKATIFSGLGRVTFGSANYTPFELAPVSAADYKDEVVTITDDPSLVNAFRTKFDRMWHDATAEAGSRAAAPPYFLNWDEACALEPACADYARLYPTPEPMSIDTSRLEPDYPSPSDLIWAQGAEFNARLVQEIDREPARVDLVAYRLTDGSVADALIRKSRAGVPVRVIIEPEQYTSRVWPEYWLTHYYVDRLWEAGIPIRQRTHAGLTHMKVLVTSAYATNASSNIATNWQRDHNWFISSTTHPAAYQAIRSRFETMWNDAQDFGPFTPQPADTPGLNGPPNAGTGVPRGTPLAWRRAPFATSYDVYFGPSPTAMAHVATVEAALTLTPPATYQWTPPYVQSATRYYWRVVSRTSIGLSSPGPTWSFTTDVWQRPGDVDGDGRSDMTIWRPSTGSWWTLSSALGTATETRWGTTGDLPVPADYDADGRTDAAVFRPSTGTWHIRYSSTGGSDTFQWGTAGDRPVPGDYDGDRRADLAVFRPADGRWWIVSPATGYRQSYVWGGLDDRPVPADYDGDGRMDPAVYRPSTGRWHLLLPATGLTFTGAWGSAGDQPVPADYDGDGRADIAVFRPATGWWFVASSTGAYLAAAWGSAGDHPVPGDYDGDGRADFAVFRPSSGWWFVQPASGFVISAPWGFSTDLPLPASP